jgi:hypothetical protein
VEHPAILILASIFWSWGSGHDFPVDGSGLVDPDDVQSDQAGNDLVSLMLANNETGTSCRSRRFDYHQGSSRAFSYGCCSGGWKNPGECG